MPDTNGDFIDYSDHPTEELYIELRDLEAIEPTLPEDAATAGEGTTEDPGGIRERIAYLRSLLADRGVTQD